MQACVDVKELLVCVNAGEQCRQTGSVTSRLSKGLEGHVSEMFTTYQCDFLRGCVCVCVCHTESALCKIFPRSVG